MSVLRVVAYGTPRPQGSKRHVGRGILVESSNVKPWRESIHHATLEAIKVTGWERATGAVGVEASYYFDRPRTHYRTGKNATLLRDNAPVFPHGRAQGDVEKLARAAHDALTSAGAWVDDCQVAWLTCGKRWTSTDVFALDRPGVILTLRLLA